jgi:phage-related protein
MKPIVFLGKSLATIRGFPDAVRREAGYQLDRLQHGLGPTDWKPMPSIGKGVTA